MKEMTDIRDLLRPVLIPIHREGWAFITLFAIVTFVVGLVWEPFWFIGGVLTVWCIFFFRNPDRVTPVREGLVISPADGVVQSIIEASPPPELEMTDERMVRIAVFMNVFNVHVNRVPIAGTVTKLHYRPGKFLNASMDKASIDNERMSVALRTNDDKAIAFVQIAGLVARRIICDLDPGQDVRTGERFGIIRFGSRVDVYLPHGSVPLVCEGQTMIAGETVLADIGSNRRGKESARKGEIR